MSVHALSRQTNNRPPTRDRKSTRLNSSHSQISYAVFCLKKKKDKNVLHMRQNHIPYDEFVLLFYVIGQYMKFGENISSPHSGTYMLHNDMYYEMTNCYMR